MTDERGPEVGQPADTDPRSPVRFGVGYDPDAGVVVLRFDRSLDHLALTVEGAAQLAQMLVGAVQQIQAHGKRIIIPRANGLKQAVASAVKGPLNG